MKLRIYQIASSVYLVLGVLHIFSHIYVIDDLKGSLIYMTLNVITHTIFFTERSFLEFLNGFSITMGFLMISFGIMNLITVWSFKEQILQKAFLIFNALVALVVSLLSFFYLVWPPVILFFLVSVAFIYLSLKIDKVLKKAP